LRCVDTLGELYLSLLLHAHLSVQNVGLCLYLYPFFCIHFRRPRNSLSGSTDTETTPVVLYTSPGGQAGGVSVYLSVELSSRPLANDSKPLGAPQGGS
jgi:hypothetical protein